MRFRDTWRLRDNFQREWLITVRPPHREPDEREHWEQERALHSLVYFAFQSHGATDEEVASVLLEVYDELTGSELARRLPYPLRDPQRQLRGFNEVLRRRLDFAARAGQLRIERIPERPWPFADEGPKQEALAPESLVEEQTTWIGVRLVDQEGNPVPRRRYRIKLTDRSVREGHVDGSGLVRIEGFAPAGECEVDFLDFDAADWGHQKLRPGALGAGRTGPAGNADDTEGAADDGVSVTIAQGEHLGSVARGLGRESFAPIWNHGDNEALRQRRKTPHALLPGDRVAIPDRKARAFRIPTGAVHTFQVVLTPLKLRLKVYDEMGEAIASTDGTLSAGGVEHAVTSDGNGKIEATIDAAVRRATLTLGEQRFVLEVGHLDPIDEVSGQLGRLRALGYFDDVVPEATDAADVDEDAVQFAWEQFQDENGLLVSGTPDDATLEKLEAVFGC